MPPRMAATLSRFAAEVPSRDMVAPPRTSEFSLRRAAILLSNLDADSRRRLLAHLPPREAANLRAATASLSDVDPLEVRRTVSAFVGRISTARDEIAAPVAGVTAARGADQERRAAPAAESSAEVAAAPPPAATSNGGLQFLHDVPDATLLRAVQSEHPQTIAVVLASIDAKQAARLLRRLEPQQRGEAIRRLGRLEDVPQEAIDDIGRHLRELIGTVGQLGSGEGRRKLASIFSELGAEDRQWLDQSVDSSDQLIAAALADAKRVLPQHADADASLRGPESPDEAVGNNAEDGASPRILPIDPQVPYPPSMMRSAGADDRERGTDTETSHTLDPSPAAWDSQGEAEEVSMRMLSGDQADAVLEKLTPVRLRAVLAELPARESLLTVCGLSPRCVRRLLRAMPRRQAKQVRQRLESLGPLELWEVDRAKRAAATVAVGVVRPAVGASAVGASAVRAA